MSLMNSSPESSLNWSVLIKQYEQSGLKRKQFCKENNISISQFKYRLSKLKRSSIKALITPIIPITIKEAPAVKPTTTTMNFQVTFNNGIYCQIPNTVTAEKLKQLMEALQSC